MDLQQYDRMKTALADILRAATMRPGVDRSSDAARDLFARLGEDRFNLVVVGRFSRGKTTLMNAMLGTDRLPTGIVPVTSVITTVTYGTEELVVLHYQHTSLFMEIPIAKLAEHVTERGNPGNIKRIANAEVQLPAELLRRGFHFIDTPGLGSSIVENTRTTLAFLPQADACILVTGYDSPLSEEERQTLETVHASGRRIFIVVNKQDCANAMQRQQVLDHLNAQLRPIFGDHPPPLFSLSAQQAMEARLCGDEQGLFASGLPALESTLLNFLVNEKRREFLLGICARLKNLLAGQVGAADDLARLEALRVEVDAVRPTATIVEAPPMPKAKISSQLPMCEMCSQMIDALFNYMAHFQHQLSGNPQAQAELAEHRGLCAPHSWQFDNIAAPKEICTGFAAVTERQAAYLRATAARGSGSVLACEAVQMALPTAQSCPACAVARAAAQNAAEAAAGRLMRDPHGALRALSAICMPHLPLLIAALPNPDVIRMVLTRQADLLERVSEDMRKFVLKRDGLLRHLTTKEEETAAKRALRSLVGSPGSQMGHEAPQIGTNVTPMVRRVGERSP